MRIANLTRRLKALPPYLRNSPSKAREGLGDINRLAKNTLGAVIKYCCNHRSRLIRFLEDGRLELGNNRAERSIWDGKGDYLPTFLVV